MIRARFALALISATVLGSVSACAHTGDDGSSETLSESKRPPAKYREHGDVNAVSDPKTAPAQPAGDLMSRMARDLAARLNVTVPELQVLAIESVTWNDGSLGCPQPGQAYTAAQTPGVRVLFQNSGKTYQYHASEAGAFVYCANPADPVGAPDRQ